MTDPREKLAARRQRPDLYAAALRLEAGAAAMRDGLTGPEPDDAEPVPGPVLEPVPGPPAVPPPPAPEPFSSERSDDDRGPRAGEYGADLGSAEVFSCERRVLNWRSRHDVRSLSFGVRPRLLGAAPLQPVLLEVPPVLDQGTEGQCVGFAAAAAAGVLGADRDAATARELYRAAQRLDDVPGEAYTGTSVLAGMQAGQQAGLWGGYLWAFGTRDIAQALLQRRAPVVIGVPWFDGMYETGPRGVVRVGGDLVGGHALVVVGLQLTGPSGEPGAHFVWLNSWGTGYGDEGLGYIANRDLAALLREQGEAAIPTAEPVR